MHVPVSTTPSLNETDYNAVNFSLWKKLGRQILIKSNINNWLVCDPGDGSLVDWQDGDINCMIIKYVTNTCKETPATSFFGPIFFIHIAVVIISILLQSMTGLSVIHVEKVSSTSWTASLSLMGTFSSVSWWTLIVHRCVTFLVSGERNLWINSRKILHFLRVK